MLSKLTPERAYPDLLVGHATSDDAAVLRIDADRAIAQTVDFFTPIVDDPRLFGAIAAANSISDIYAMGAEPILALAIAAFPTDKLPLSVLQEILAGGEEKAKEAGFPIAGGHTIIDDVPKYGLAVTGIVDTARIIRNSTARAGDAIYLSKPIGNGILISAYRALAHSRVRKTLKRTEAPSLDEAVSWMMMLNRDAARGMRDVGVTAATDITGYGFIGHLHEVCDASRTGATISVGAVPLLAGVRDWLLKGYFPGGSERNAEAFRRHVDSSVTENDYRLLCDAQTSGGLLMSVAPEMESRFESWFHESGLLCAKVGRMTERSGVIELKP